jgi:replicative DNA helicase Mcm
VELEQLKGRFDNFFEDYYRDSIDNLNTVFPEKNSMLVDIRRLSEFDPDLAAELIENPEIILEAAQLSLKGKINVENKGEKEVHVRFFGQTINTPLVQDVGSAFIGKLINIDCLVVKRSEIIPKVNVCTYKCAYCGFANKLRIDKDEPLEICPQCKRKSLKQDVADSKFINLQKLAVQDPLEKLRGNTPTWQLEVWIEDDLVNTIIPGDRIDLTGILRVRNRKSSKGKTETTLFTMFLDTVSIVPKQKEFADIEITDDEVRQIKELANDPQIFEKISKSIASSIYGHSEIKQAVALQLFGGTPNKFLVDGGIIRSDMHILLIGDPGSAKTRILQSVSKLVPKGIYVSGKSVTGGGMTAVAERDELSEGGWTLKAGALVLGSGGIVSIDEFDKINEEDRASLHEALESQTISVAKAGIIATFNARCAVLAAANPKYGRFDANTYPAEQFDIPPTLLSRFDLIFPIRDVLDEELDKQIAKHILTQHRAAGAQISSIQNYEQVEKPPLDGEFLRKYIAYARKNVFPRVENEATDKIQTYYIELRKLGARQGAVPITPRQIEGLVRMAEASAKTRLSTIVTAEDAERAISLSEFMLKNLAVDRGGRRDIDTILTGMPKEKIDKINAIMGIIKRLEEQEGRVRMQRITEEAEKAGIDGTTAERFIRELERSGDIFSPRPGEIKIVRHDNE